MSRGARGGEGRLRIIGGQWRGRKLVFATARGLRPTADRVRETLFNWLAPVIRDARCLDLFAGSGALGLEALSRGAAHCDFVDASGQAVRQIREHLGTLGAADRGTCHQGDALEFLARASGPWDIAFIDPPFGQRLAGPSCERLARAGSLAAGALVYVETAAAEPAPTVPPHWECHREKRAGGVGYRLFVVHPG